MENKYSDKYYSFVLDKGIELTTEEKIVFSIINDFTDRRGLRQEWEQIDNDIQEEIIEEWINIVKKQLKTN